VLQKLSATSYDTGWVTPASGVAWGSITGTLSSQTDLYTALGTKLEKAGDTFTGNLQATNGSGVFLSNIGPSYLYSNHTYNYSQYINGGVGGGSLTVEWDGITFAAGKQTLPYPGAVTLFTSPVLTGDPTAPTPATSDNDTSIATTAFVKAQGYLTSAPVTSVAGRTGAITLSNTDISGLGSLAVVNDAPSDGSQYARKNAAWEVVTTTPDFISSVSSPLAVTTGNLTIDLSAYAPLASPVFTGDARAVTPTFGDDDTSIATTAFVQAGLLGGTANARNLEVYVRNQSGASIPAGSIVYVSGATGNRPLITLSQANNDANSAQTMGFTKTTIANNAFGYVIVRGEVENLDTSALTEGDQLYLSPTVAGAYTTTKPTAPQHLVYVGIVIRSHPTLGTILVAVQNGYELGEIHDVSLGTLVNNDLLAYESSTDLWKNKTFSALGLLTSADAGTTYAPLAGATFTGKINTVASDATNTGFNIAHGVAPTLPLNGDIWTTTAGLFMRQNGATRQYVDIEGPQTISGAKIFSGASLTFGNSTTSGTINIGSGATASGTRTINIGNNSSVGATNNINIGSLVGTSTTTLRGDTNGVTRTAGDNTTKLATTAFVTAAVPAFGTTADINEPSSTTKVTSLDAVRRMLLHPGFQLLYLGAGQSQTALGGYFDNNLGGRWKQFDISTTSGSRAQFTFDNSSGSNGLVGLVPGQALYVKNYSKKVYMTGRAIVGQISGSQFGDINSIARINLGGKNGFGGGDLQVNLKGFGWLVAGGGQPMKLQVCNGPTVTTVTSSFTPTSGQVFDWELYSDGAGNVTLTINDTVVATTTQGPTGLQNYGLYLEGVDAIAASVSFALQTFGTKIYFSK
jgi:hypothetical protein